MLRACIACSRVWTGAPVVELMRGVGRWKRGSGPYCSSAEESPGTTYRGVLWVGGAPPHASASRSICRLLLTSKLEVVGHFSALARAKRLWARRFFSGSCTISHGLQRTRRCTRLPRIEKSTAEGASRWYSSGSPTASDKSRQILLPSVGSLSEPKFDRELDDDSSASSPQPLPIRALLPPLPGSSCGAARPVQVGHWQEVKVTLRFMQRCRYGMCALGCWL
mmetsp:Transcript_52527/g.105215  ORF Transcript_52527/g.105215 Transcript_52527/m.105215 type:complete len:222 (-) Transcript_52527:33-698(-)